VDPHDVERVAILSIKPEYAEAIFVGRKKVEFRRSRLAPDIELAIVYATQPIGRIIGWFRVAGIAESTPDGLWRRFRHHGAIRRRDYFRYFAGADRAYAIEIADPTAVNEPLLLNCLSPGLRAPQSFQYLPAPLAAPIITSHRRADTRRPELRPAFA
jgi:predicted transcriptional regulator